MEQEATERDNIIKQYKKSRRCAVGCCVAGVILIVTCAFIPKLMDTIIGNQAA